MAEKKASNSSVKNEATGPPGVDADNCLSGEGVRMLTFDRGVLLDEKKYHTVNPPVMAKEEAGFHPVWDTILRSCVKNYFFECLTSILDNSSYLRYHTLVYEKSQSSPPSLMALIAFSPGSEHM
jgi:hypothetical protein